MNTNPCQSSLGSGLACWGWRQYILKVQIAQQLGILLGQLGAQGLDHLPDLGVLLQSALEEPADQVKLCLDAFGGELVGLGQAVVRMPEILQLDVPLVDEAGQTIIDAAQGHTHVSAELALGPPGVLGQKAEYLEPFYVLLGHGGGASGFITGQDWEKIVWTIYTYLSGLDMTNESLC